MRTLRVTLAGMVLLGALSGAVVAQDDAEAQMASGEATVFDGRYRPVDEGVFQAPTIESYPAEGRALKQMVRDYGVQRRLDSISDPRLNGTVRQVRNEDWFLEDAARVRVEAFRIDNADGSWLGHLIGYMDQERSSQIHYQGVLAGSGAYEGLTAIVFIESPGTSDARFHGLILPGDLPELPDYPAPPAE